MASAAEQLAANLNFGAFAKATELKKRIWFTLGALIVYRLGTYIPLPGIDPLVLQDVFRQNSGGILGMFDMFAGGALSRMTIFALNIMPYISASIIMQLMTTVSPKLEALKKEGESGRKKINQYTRYGTVIITAFQAYGIAVGLEGMRSSAGPAASVRPCTASAADLSARTNNASAVENGMWRTPKGCARRNSSVRFLPQSRPSRKTVLPSVGSHAGARLRLPRSRTTVSSSHPSAGHADSPLRCNLSSSAEMSA